MCHSVVSLQPYVLAFQMASLVDVADRGKPTLSGIAECRFCLVLWCGPLRLGSVARTSPKNLASVTGMCLFGGFEIVVVFAFLFVLDVLRAVQCFFHFIFDW